MKTITVLKIFLFLFFFNCQCFSQESTYKQGYYTTHTGDTVNGYFSAKEKNLKKGVRFRNNLTEKKFIQLSLDDVNAISFGKKNYLNWYGKRGITYVRKFDFEIMNIDSSVTERIVLKLIYKGVNLSLYHFFDLSDHFFIGHNNTVQELSISYRYLTSIEKKNYPNPINAPNYFITPVFRDQILSIFNNKLAKRQRLLIENCLYESLPLVRLFNQLDGSL